MELEIQKQRRRQQNRKCIFCAKKCLLADRHKYHTQMSLLFLHLCRPHSDNVVQQSTDAEDVYFDSEDPSALTAIKAIDADSNRWPDVRQFTSLVHENGGFQR